METQDVKKNQSAVVVSKSGDKLLTYYDTANEGYRTAKGKYTLIAVGGNQ